jgi:hypothetical protein
MQTINKQSITIDLKQTTMIPLPQFIQNDSNILEFTILENGVAADLSNIGRIVVNYKREDKVVVDRLLVPEGNVLTYQIGAAEMEESGYGEVEIQFYSLDSIYRVSTKKFKVYMAKSIGVTYVESEDLTPLQELFVEVYSVNSQIEATEAVRNQNETTRQNQEATRQTNTTNAINNLNTEVNKLKLDFKAPVASFAAIATTYPTPQVGWAVQVTDGVDAGKIYRYSGTSWQYIQTVAVGPLTDIQNKLEQVNRQTQTLVHGPYNVLNGSVNAPVNIQIEGRTLIPMQNNVLEATKLYVLADKRTKLKWADASITSGVAKFTGKAERPALVAVANYEGKISGSTLENPHIIASKAGITLYKSSEVMSEHTTTGYASATKLDGQLITNSTNVLNEMAQTRFSKDIIQEIERRLGRIPRATLADKIQWAKDNVKTLVFNWNGNGSGPFGNKAYVAWFSETDNQYYGTISHTSGAVAPLTLTIDLAAAGAINVIDSKGFATFNAYADPSNVTAWSTISTDYTSLEIELKPTAVLHDPRAALYEVTQAHYDAILNTWTEDEVTRRYPISQFNHLQNPYLMAEGEQLLPSFYDWDVINGFSKINGAYDLEMNTTATFQANYTTIAALPNQAYTFKGTYTGTLGRYSVRVLDANGSELNRYDLVSDQVFTFTTNANAKFIRVYADTTTATGKFMFTNPMLTLGNVVKPFVPRNQSYLFFETKLAEIRGVTADKIFEKDGKYFKQKSIETVDLDGNWSWSFYMDGSGYKHVTFPHSVLNGVQASNARLTVTKYNGKTLTSITVISLEDQAYFGSSAVNISISDIESGWGETYNPTSNEIKGYFNGWQAKTVDANGKPTAWKSIVDGTDAPTQTDVYIAANKAPNYTTYKLLYPLANPTIEEIKFEGSIFANSLTMVEAGTGVVFREKVTPQQISGSLDWLINEVGITQSATDSPLKNKTNLIIDVYKNGLKDTYKWVKAVSTNNKNGNMYLQVKNNDYDPTAEYTVTYVVYDKPTYTSNPVNVTATYANNIRTALEDTAKKTEDNATEISVIKNNYAKKSKMPWIAPTLLNAWVNFGGTNADAGYTKDDFGFVHLRGRIKTGTLAQSAFILPVGFRPDKDLVIASVSNGAFGYLTIKSDGNVVIEAGSNTSFSLQNISFRVEG